MNLLADVMDPLNEQVALSASVGAGDESIEVTARGSSTSMGPNGWNPNPT
jgi:hypothetical protein